MQSYTVNTPGTSNTGGTNHTSRTDGRKVLLNMQSNHASGHKDSRLLMVNKDMSFQPESAKFNGPLNTSGSVSARNDLGDAAS